MGTPHTTQAHYGMVEIPTAEGPVCVRADRVEYAGPVEKKNRDRWGGPTRVRFCGGMVAFTDLTPDEVAQRVRAATAYISTAEWTIPAHKWLGRPHPVKGDLEYSPVSGTPVGPDEATWETDGGKPVIEVEKNPAPLPLVCTQMGLNTPDEVDVWRKAYEQAGEEESPEERARIARGLLGM